MLSRIEARLLEDPVGNVMALKFLSLLGAASEYGLLERDGRWATWFHYAPQQFYYDASQYRDRSRIVYWNSNDRETAAESLTSLPAGSVIKVSTEPCLSLARELWPEINVFVGYSTQRLTPVEYPCERFDRVHEDLLALSAENGYSPEDLKAQEARGCRWFVARVEGVARALCYVQPNFGNIWEVSGVYTRPDSRRQGLARAVVIAALNDLVDRGLTPRYFVHDQNHASLGVVRSLGLEQRWTTRHFAVP